MNGFDNQRPGGYARVELASRNSAGIHVALLWAEDTNRVAVLVSDDSTDDHFELAVDPSVNALDAFEHPYAYAAWRGVDYQQAGLRNAA